MDDIKINFNIRRIRETARIENGKLILGGIVEEYDDQGHLVSQTQSDNVGMGWSDGSPFTISDARKYDLKIDGVNIV